MGELFGGLCVLLLAVLGVFAHDAYLIICHGYHSIEDDDLQ